MKKNLILVTAFVTFLAPALFSGAAQADYVPSLHFLSLGNASKNTTDNSKLKVPIDGTADLNETLVVAVAVGPVTGKVRCSDTQGNTYTVTVNKRTQTDRLVMCVAAITHPLVLGDHITIKYPVFDGISIASVEHISALDSPGVVDSTVVGSGKKININASPVTPTVDRELLFGAVLTHGGSNFFSTGGTEEYQAYSNYSSGDSENDKKLTFYYFTSGDPIFTSPYSMQGSQMTAGPWIAVQVNFLATESQGNGADT